MVVVKSVTCGDVAVFVTCGAVPDVIVRCGIVVKLVTCGNVAVFVTCGDVAVI
jgi:hypothetical protein